MAHSKPSMNWTEELLIEKKTQRKPFVCPIPGCTAVIIHNKQ